MCKSYKDIKEMDEYKRQNYLHETSEYAMHSISEDIYLNLLEDETIDPISKWYAIKAIGETKKAQYIPILVGILQKQNVKIGETSLHLITAYSLGKIGNSVVPFVIPLLDDKYSEETQIAAVDVLGEIGSNDGIPSLVDAIISKSRNVAIWAGLSLSKIGVPTVKEQIRIYNLLPDEKKIIVLDSLMRINDINAMNFVAEQFCENTKMHDAFINQHGTVYVHFINFLQENHPTMYKLLKGNQNG